MDYEEFQKHMETKFPKMFKDKHYGGFCVGEGWYHILESLCGNIQHKIHWKRKQRAWALQKVRAKAKGLDAMIQFTAGKGKIPTEWDIERAEHAMEEDIVVPDRVDHITVLQIKEKFGGLRFYYQGGDAEVHGMVTMAEAWAGFSCEVCGERGERRNSGWIRTLCDVHEAQRVKSL